MQQAAGQQPAAKRRRGAAAAAGGGGDADAAEPEELGCVTSPMRHDGGAAAAAEAPPATAAAEPAQLLPLKDLGLGLATMAAVAEIVATEQAATTAGTSVLPGTATDGSSAGGGSEPLDPFAAIEAMDRSAQHLRPTVVPAVQRDENAVHPLLHHMDAETRAAPMQALTTQGGSQREGQQEGQQQQDAAAPGSGQEALMGAADGVSAEAAQALGAAGDAAHGEQERQGHSQQVCLAGATGGADTAAAGAVAVPAAGGHDAVAPAEAAASGPGAAGSSDALLMEDGRAARGGMSGSGAEAPAAADAADAAATAATGGGTMAASAGRMERPHAGPPAAVPDGQRGAADGAQGGGGDGGRAVSPGLAAAPGIAAAQQAEHGGAEGGLTLQQLQAQQDVIVDALDSPVGQEEEEGMNERVQGGDGGAGVVHAASEHASHAGGVPQLSQQRAMQPPSPSGAQLQTVSASVPSPSAAPAPGAAANCNMPMQAPPEDSATAPPAPPAQADAGGGCGDEVRDEGIPAAQPAGPFEVHRMRLRCLQLHACPCLARHGDGCVW